MGTTNAILASIDAINAEIKKCEEQIVKLVTARDTLGELVTVEEAIDSGHVDKRARERAAVEAQAEEVVPKRRRRRAADVEAEAISEADDSTSEAAQDASSGDSSDETEATPPRSARSAQRRTARAEKRAKMTPSEAGEALVETVVKATRREAAKPAPKATPAKATTKRTAAKSSNGDKPNRREQIAKLLKQGKAPREVADALGIAPNYVYHVKRSL